jgi:hypothetical protein
LKKRPSKHLHKLPTQRNKVSSRTLQMVLVLNLRYKCYYWTNLLNKLFMKCAFCLLSLRCFLLKARARVNQCPMLLITDREYTHNTCAVHHCSAFSAYLSLGLPQETTTVLTYWGSSRSELCHRLQQVSLFTSIREVNFSNFGCVTGYRNSGFSWSLLVFQGQFLDLLHNRPRPCISKSRSGNFSLRNWVQTGSGVHPTSYLMGTRGSFPGSKAVGA